MSEIAVDVQSVSKKFRLYHERNQSIKSALMRRRVSVHEDFWALKDVSFSVPKGSTFALIGSNGSGKSTLLKCLAQILYPDEGTIVAHGKVASLLEVGSGFHPELSGRENVYLNGSILGMTKKEIDEKYDRIVEFADIEQFMDQPVKNYSSGMYVRLGFSVAIHVEPEILIVDEILAVGDANFQAKCRDKFADLREQGKTVIFVSHSLATVKDMCDQAAWIDNGVLRVVGDVDDVIAAYSYGVNVVPEALRSYVNSLQRGTSPLGWPVTTVREINGGHVQAFSNGAVVWRDLEHPVSLAGAIRAFYDTTGGVGGALGWPISEPYLTEDKTFAQDFELGTIELTRSGIAFIRPEN